MYDSIKNRFLDISHKIQAACIQARRSKEDIKLIAVSKLQSIEVINSAYEIGIKNFGENYAQELSEKTLECPSDIVWHFIGPIQSNKIGLIAECAHWVHSIDREKVAKKLNAALDIKGKKVHSLIQVNIDREESKGGIYPEEVLDFARMLDANYPNLILEGLMFMPKINASKEARMHTMKNINTLHNSLIAVFPNCKHLSLGPSSDFEESIIAGSTIIRIGESLLGHRS